jgi:plastocyanin
MRLTLLVRITFIVLSALILAVGLATGSTDETTIDGRVIVSGLPDSSDAVVYIDSIPGKTFAPPTTPVTLDQVNLRFTPHVLPVLAGTNVAFPNSDPVRHNVFSPTASWKFNLGTYPRGSTKFRVFDKPGAFTLLCNVHAEMSAYVIVTETPYFAVTDKAGAFTIRHIPPGTYLLKTWHAKARPFTRNITVAEGGIRNLEIELRK